MSGTKPLAARGVTASRLAAIVPRVAIGAVGMFFFILALQVIKSGAKGLVPILDGLDVHGGANSVGFGWLLAYLALERLPGRGYWHHASRRRRHVRNRSVWRRRRIPPGRSFIVLAVGFFLFLRKQRNADGLYIGVVALLTTITTQGPAILLGLVSLHYGWLDGVQFETPNSLLNIIDRVYGPPVDAVNAALPRLGAFGAGVALLLASFTIFDRALPQLDGEAEGVTRLFGFLNRRPLMFLMGCLVTMTTLSVSISLTVLVPLSLKGYLKRDTSSLMSWARILRPSSIRLSAQCFRRRIRLHGRPHGDAFGRGDCDFRPNRGLSALRRFHPAAASWATAAVPHAHLSRWDCAVPVVLLFVWARFGPQIFMCLLPAGGGCDRFA